jgi:quercetin dioxygenase-like cupin family protein
MEYRLDKWNEDGEPDANEFMARMRAEGYRVFQWTDAAGAVYSAHEHGEDQSHWIISGTLELTVRGVGRVILGPGDRDFMPAGTVHSARVAGNAPVVYLIGAKR